MVKVTEDELMETKDEGIQPLTECEKLVMKTIWDASDEELGLTDVMNRVNAKYDRAWKPQTVSTFLSRLVSKGYLKHYRQGRVFYYEILVPLDDYRCKATNDFVNFWDNGNADQFIADLMHCRPLRNEEIYAIKEIINKL